MVACVWCNNRVKEGERKGYSNMTPQVGGYSCTRTKENEKVSLLLIGGRQEEGKLADDEKEGEDDRR